MSDLNFLKSFLTEDLYILKEEESVVIEKSEEKQQTEVKEYKKEEEVIQANIEEPADEIISKPFPPHKGSFNKKILIAVSDSNSQIINDSELDFLLKILSAVKLSVDDVAIINIEKSSVDLIDLTNWSATHYISFTGEANTTLYEPTSKENIQHLNCHKLGEISKDKGKKQQLWTALQQLFLK